MFADADTAPDADALPGLLHEELVKWFKPAFLGRVRLVPYVPLDDTVLRRIVSLQLDRIRQRFRSRFKAELEFDPAIGEVVAGRCTESSAGARAIEGILSDTLLPELSTRVLEHMARGLAVSAISVDMEADGAFRYFVR